ncbi:hypothetical protein ACFRAQ_35995 [Nocardia sp. NPDC056611]|uniref:hypothetical protein n=1 Tax=Nocardia sp. NPDC056611 TaxID=3345877 RepID=UPI0036701E5E
MNYALEPVSHVRYSLGALIGLPIAALVFGILGLILAVSVVKVIKNVIAENGDADAFADGVIWGGGALIPLAISAAVFVGAWWPFDWEYHQWRPVRGEVAQIDSRMLSDGDKGMSQMFVVRYAQDTNEYRCDDSRCAAVKPGDVLELTCKRAWQWTGTPGRECQFVETVRR